MAPNNYSMQSILLGLHFSLHVINFSWQLLWWRKYDLILHWQVHALSYNSNKSTN